MLHASPDAAEKRCAAKIVAEAKRARAEEAAFQEKVNALLADAAKEHKKLKAAAKASEQEVEAFRGAGTRIVAAHSDACTKLATEARSKTETVLTEPINLGGIGA